MVNILEDVDGPILFRQEEFHDERGKLSKLYWSRIGEIFHYKNVKEVFYTTSNKNVIRAFHFQKKPKPINKIISVVSGKILEVIVDMRKESKFFGIPISQEINANDKFNNILIPVGFAHGYEVLENNTVVQYLFDEMFNSELDSGFSYLSFGDIWTTKNPIVSRKDLTLLKFHELNFES